MKASNTERLTPIGGGWRSWVGQGVLLVLLLLGPDRLAHIISLVTSTLTFPVTGNISSTGNAYEVFNLELLMIYLIVVIGLNLLVQVGLLSIGQTAPFAVGAYFVAIMTLDHHWSFFAALAGATALTGGLGILLGIPSLRLGIFTFAMVTLGYAIVSTDLANGWKFTGGGVGLAGIRLPKPFDTPNNFYWLLAIVLVIAYVVGRNYIRSPLGRAAAGVSGSPVAAQSMGINVHLSKLRAFALASAFAGAAGGLYAALLGFIAPDSFALDLDVLWVLMVLLGGGGTIAGPIVGAIVLFRIPLAAQTVTKQPGQWSLLVYGIVLLLSVQFFPRGIMSGWTALRQWLFRRRTPERAAHGRPEVSGMLEKVTTDLKYVLEVHGVSKNLSGVQALRDVDLSVAPGTVHALIGPNGSGKTTLLNVMSGFLDPDAGNVMLLGEDVTHASVHSRARQGLGRTFQTPYIFEDVTCRDNILVALDRHRRHNALSYILRLAYREERRHYQRALELLDAVGLGAEATTPAGRLPPGDRRLLELARVLALNPKVVLMDEPAAGLTAHEIDELEEAIGALRSAGVAVLLVEHHVDFVLRLADIVTVIDFGSVIARGDPHKVRTDPKVLSAYLGDPEETEGALPEGTTAVEEELEDRLATTSGDDLGS